METGEVQSLRICLQRFADLPKGEWNQAPERGILLPLAQQGQKRPAGVFVAGLNPHRALGENSKDFSRCCPTRSRVEYRNAVAYEAERNRAEQLAELDRAKTKFFSNVSHEFRTPLTLMLGPLEEVSAGSARASEPGKPEQLVAARRNALRLLKLVNTLLDFSRIEAGASAGGLRTDGSGELYLEDRQRLSIGNGEGWSAIFGRLRAARRAYLCRSRHVGEDRSEPAVERIQIHL